MNLRLLFFSLCFILNAMSGGPFVHFNPSEILFLIILEIIAFIYIKLWNVTLKRKNNKIVDQQMVCINSINWCRNMAKCDFIEFSTFLCYLARKFNIVYNYLLSHAMKYICFIYANIYGSYSISMKWIFVNFFIKYLLKPWLLRLMS